VSRIDVAPDHRHVEVAYDLVVSVLGRLRLAADRGQQTKITVPVDLRAQLGQTGVTGVKYVLIDFFDPLTHPPPQLSFRPPERYIPATPSTLKDIEEAVVRAIDEFPKIAEQSQHVIAQLDTILASLAEQRVPEHAVATLAQVDQTLTVMRKKLDEVDVKQLSSDTHATLASLQRASDSIGDMTRGSRNYSQDFASALRELRSAAESFRQLAEAVELDPDMLVKGRARGRR
jgi:paraquat-inducible protein B